MSAAEVSKRAGWALVQEAAERSAERVGTGSSRKPRDPGGRFWDGSARSRAAVVEVRQVALPHGRRAVGSTKEHFAASRRLRDPADFDALVAKGIAGTPETPFLRQISAEHARDMAKLGIPTCKREWVEPR